MDSSARSLRQQLESLSRSGLTHLPRPKPPAGGVAQATAAAPVPVRAPPPAPRPLSQPLKAPMAQPKAVVSEMQAAPQTNDARAPRLGAHAAALPKSTATLSDRRNSLAILAAKVKECTRCAELARTRTQTVFGVGNPQSRILFIGEAPGADEDAQGEPFVGRSGRLLNEIITASRLTREELYICNVVKCRPPDNRNPSDDECANCSEYLEGQLAAIDPEYIVCWGGVAAKNLLKSPLAIGKLRGMFHRYGRAKVLCTYHPSYLLRNASAKKEVWHDMQFLMADMGVDLKSKV